MISSKTKIGLLVAVHTIAGLLLACASWRFRANYNVGFSPAEFGLNALAFAQSGLLGIWGALGTTRPGWRLSAVIAATSYVGALVISAGGHCHAGVRTVVFFLQIACPTVVILLLLSRFRHGRRRLHLARSHNLPPTGKVFQYTILHLLLSTAVVAVLLAIDRGLRTFTHRDGETTFIECGRLVLLCPAWKRFGSAKIVPESTVILHSRADDVVPFADSEELVNISGCALIEVGLDHRLADSEPLAAMLKVCETTR